jgi:hypothetical protein
MKQFIAILLAATLCITAAYAGTFSDSFDDGNLDGWNVWRMPETKPPKVEQRAVVMDTIIEKDDKLQIMELVYLELIAGNAKSWRDYTLTCRVKFSKALQECMPSFSIAVRRSLGRFDVMAEHYMMILPFKDYVGVNTIPPDAKFNPQKGIEGTIGRGRIKKSMKLNKWYHIKIVAMENHFEFYFDDDIVTVYDDETAVPGTVQFQADTGMRSHLDDVIITGPNIPNIGTMSVKMEYRITMTWGKIKEGKTAKRQDG